MCSATRERCVRQAVRLACASILLRDVIPVRDAILTVYSIERNNEFVANASEGSEVGRKKKKTHNEARSLRRRLRAISEKYCVESDWTTSGREPYSACHIVCVRRYRLRARCFIARGRHFGRRYSRRYSMRTARCSMAGEKTTTND